MPKPKNVCISERDFFVPQQEITLKFQIVKFQMIEVFRLEKYAPLDISMNKRSVSNKFFFVKLVQ